ncbi:MAG: hypothetical protein NWR72_12210 [Bacteroidia bacterium]|nr:hypothetical protein [Bacteroidia bacterium]
MIELNLKIQNPEDLQILLPLLNRLGVSWTRVSEEPKEVDRLKELIARGGDTSYVGDPATWQREVREDRPLPYPDAE